MKMRELCDSPMYLLTDEITDEAIEKAKEIGDCGIDFNGNVEENLADGGAAIRKVTDAKLPVAAWTIDSPEVFATLIGYGVDCITTDCITY